MKISKKILNLLHDQIAMEANASNYYLYISSWCKVNGYDGASSFFQHHSTEERDHMLKIIFQLIFVITCQSHVKLVYLYQ